VRTGFFGVPITAAGDQLEGGLRCQRQCQSENDQLQAKQKHRLFTTCRFWREGTIGLVEQKILFPSCAFVVDEMEFPFLLVVSDRVYRRWHGSSQEGFIKLFAARAHLSFWPNRVGARD